MARLNLAHTHWLSVAGSARPAAELSERGRSGFGLSTECFAFVAELSRNATALPALFSRARMHADGCGANDGMGGDDGARSLSRLESERAERATALLPLEHELRACREMLHRFAYALSPGERWYLDDALCVVETEYVRLCDAQRFHYERRLRQVRTGEDDDDPEFTVVLERIVCAADRDDDVEAAVTRAVQTIVGFSCRDSANHA